MRKALGRPPRRLEAIARGRRDRRRHAAIAATAPARDRVAVFYGHDRIPAPDEPVHGGTVKLQHLQGAFPNAPRSFNVLYLGSSNRPHDSGELLRLARARQAAIVVNQDGVAYAGWHGPGWERANQPLAELVQAADHVVFQSAFCKASSDRFLGPREGGWEILHNPVDTDRFAPGDRVERPLTLLLGGNQYQRYRFEGALEAFELVLDARPGACLLVSGRISWDPDRRKAEREARELLAASPASARVELVGTFTQLEAPSLYRRADLLVHTKYNDPCPTVVLEAMACGLPVVYSSSGGTPELVGPDAGVGIPAPLDWEQDHPPDPAVLAAAVLEAAWRREELGAAARARAVERFDVRPWIERHRVLFEELARSR